MKHIENFKTKIPISKGESDECTPKITCLMSFLKQIEHPTDVIGDGVTLPKVCFDSLFIKILEFEFLEDWAFGVTSKWSTSMPSWLVSRQPVGIGETKALLASVVSISPTFLFDVAEGPNVDCLSTQVGTFKNEKWNQGLLELEFH